MSFTEIQSRHIELEGTKSTQSAKIVNELKSQAHKDRGELLALVHELQDANTRLQKELKTVRSGV